MDKQHVLLAITTYNQIAYTRSCFQTLEDFSGTVICLDDASESPIAALCDSFGIECISRSEGKGLTYSWNLAYRLFLERGFEKLVISNNDVLFPRGSLQALVSTLEEYPYVGVMTREQEPWARARAQAVERFYDLPSSIVDEPKNYQLVQNIVQSAPLPPIELELVYGFCFGINRSMTKHQFSEGHLFNPANVNTSQEQDLGSRAPQKMLCRSAFVYHFKSATFGPLTPDLKKKRNELHLFRRKPISTQDDS